MSRGGQPIIGSYYGDVKFGYENHPIESEVLEESHLEEDENPWRSDYDVRNGYKSTS